MMHVVQLLPELNEGGVERGVVELNRELVKLGVESSVVSAGGKQARQICMDGGCHFEIDLASKNVLTANRRMRQLRALLRKINPDIIHARSRVPAWLAIMANRKLNIPFVTTVHGFNSVNAYSRVMTRGDRVICVSNAIKDFVQAHYGIPEEKCVVIPRGVDLDRFNPDKVDQFFAAEFSRRYELEGKFVVTHVGRITQLKDLETLIDALVLAKKSNDRLVGLLVGGVRQDKQDYFESLRQRIKVAGAEGYIHFVGSQDMVPEIVSLSHVIVSSSKKPESFGRSAAEALAMRVPVVATNHGGVIDIVIPGQTGWLFPPGDINALKEAIHSCATIDVSGLRAFVEGRFSLATMVDSTLAVYRAVVNQSRFH